jgi:phenylalanyl-tRNA synthetase beta chain
MFAGMRPINNIVDITNYVMLEYGQPIHAFDIRQVEDGIIKVALAAKGSKFTTLDGNERELDGTMLTINDNNKPIALAGVMGGLNSEIESDTQEILVESANFSADSIRKTSKKLGIRSEASSRYEKGVSAELASTAADRVCSLIAQTGSGKVLSGIVDNYPGKSEMPIIKVRPARINKVLGTDLSAEQMKGILESLEIDVASVPALDAGSIEIFNARPPHIRLDLKEEVDFVEEVGRLFGYNNLDVSIHKDSEESGVPRNWALRSKVREILTALGFNEIQTYSFTSPTAATKSGAPEGSPLLNQVTLITPLGEENSVMRTSLLPEILEISVGNLNKGNEEGKLFELGNTFQTSVIAGSTRNPVPNGKPDEKMSLSISTFGKDTDFYLIKGVIEELLARLGYVSITFESTEDIPSYHPGRCASVKALGRNAENEIPLGYFGELHPDVKANYGIDAPIYAGELDLDALCNNAELMREYFPLGRFPASTIDLAFVADEEVQVGDIEKSIASINSNLLTALSLFDVYRGKQLGEGKKSLAFNLTFRAEDRTLTDEEVNSLVTKIIAAVGENTGATLREV